MVGTNCQCAVSSLFILSTKNLVDSANNISQGTSIDIHSS